MEKSSAAVAPFDLSSANCSSKSSLEPLEKLWKESVLCDCVFVNRLHQCRIAAHAVVMAASSPFLKTLIIHKQLEKPASANVGSDGDGKKDALLEIDVGDVDADVLQCIVEYAYKGCLPDLALLDDVFRLFIVADQWCFESLAEECCVSLEKRLRSENCVDIWQFSSFYHRALLAHSARMYLLRNFVECTVRSSELLQLDGALVVDLLHDDCLNVPSEESILFFIQKWTAVDRNSRAAVVPQLLRQIRYGLIIESWFLDCKEDQLKDLEMLRGFTAEDLKVIVDARYHQLPQLAKMFECSPPHPNLDHYLLRPRIPHQIMFAIGGWSNGSPTNCMETYDNKADRWFLSAYAESTTRAYHGAVELNRLIYVIGGYDGSDHYNSVRTFCPILNEWNEVAPMYSARCYVSVAILDDEIYAIGGSDGHQRLRSVERYNATKNQWTLIASMQRQRSDAGTAVLNGELYVAGGFNGFEVLDSVECYNPMSGLWRNVAAMGTRRSGLSVVAHKQYLYALGGFDGQQRLRSGEKFDCDVCQWQQIAEMRSVRSNFAVALFDEHIYAIGGYDGTKTIANVERYDCANDRWEDVGSMNLNRSAVKACVVQLPNAAHYSFHAQHSLVTHRQTAAAE